MKEQCFLPEGRLIGKAQNEQYFSSIKMLERAMREGIILEAAALSCAKDTLDLTVDLGVARGIIPRGEAAWEPDGSPPRDIAVITRVGRPVSFIVTDIGDGEYPTVRLSRRAVQKACFEEYVSRLVPGDIIDASVTHLDPFGAFVDVGCGVTSLLSIDCISVSRISHPSGRLKKGQALKVAVKNFDENGRLYVTLRELLGTWEENAADIVVGSTVAGIVRSVEDYGIFVELTPNLAGLAERRAGVKEGDACAVYVKNIIRDRMKIKLSIIDTYPAPSEPTPLKYFVDTSRIRHIDSFRYSPLVCPKVIETIF